MANHLYAFLFVSFVIGVSRATQNYIHVVPENETTESPCQGHCYTLEHVLTHHEKFFISNTTIELFPGQYIVNKSFGNVVIDNVENQIVKGKISTIDIICAKYATLGLYFFNATNVSLSNIRFSNCNGGEQSDRVITLTRDTVFYSSVFYYLGTSTLVFATSSNIYVTNLTVSDAQGIGLLVLGVSNTFLISNSIFFQNILNCIILTLAEGPSVPSKINSTHKYTITESWFINGKTTTDDSPGITIASGLSVLFAHKEHSTLYLLLSNVTLLNNKAKEGNLLFSLQNCESVSANEKPLVIIDVDGIVSEGSLTSPEEQFSTKGLVMNPWNFLCNSETMYYEFIFSMHNSRFIRSCVELRIYFKIFSMKDVSVQRTTCWCPNAVRIVPQIRNNKHRSESPYSIQNLSVIESCGSQNLVEIAFLSGITFQGNNTFLNNSGTIIFIYFQNSLITFNSDTMIANSTSNTSPFHVESSLLYINGNIQFENNTGRQCGGIQVIQSNVEQRKQVVLTFSKNKGFNGGALAFYDGSQLKADGTIVFENNLAFNYGGAIYVDDAGYWNGKHDNRPMLMCFYWDIYGSRMHFANNTAMITGSALYGGWIDVCIQLITYISPKPKMFLWITGSVNLTNTIDNLSKISSNPSRVCLCINSTPQCNITEYTYERPLSPGESFHIQAVAVGQRFGVVPSPIIAQLVNSSVMIDDLEQLQNAGRECTTLNYTIRSPNTEETLLLTVEKNFIPKLDLMSIASLQKIPFYEEQLLVFNQLTVALTISNCPLGYSFNNVSITCTCQETLTNNGVECYIQNKTVIRMNQMWINATFTHTVETIGNPGVIVHQNCPFDFCKNLNEQYLDLQYPNDQCAFGRSGVLCGECPQTYSHVLGTSECKRCSNAWIVSVLLFMLTGLGLVALLIILDLTVSIGTINGLIYYAHIVRANQASFFPPQMANTFPSWFIAWLNLDLGVEMCFFDGFDAYIKTWLQFIFPIYIWVIVIIIIVSSHYYTFAARLSGSNAVQVLATLFLMSYAKLLRITITVFSSTILVYPDGYQKRVWLYDGNVDYLKGKHIPLFIAALMLLTLLSIPYTLVLLCIQWLRLLPSYRILFWVRKFKPLFDAYTGVYKRQHGYWTGLLLLVRAGLFLVLALNILGEPSINLLATASSTFCLITYLASFGGMYRQRYINLIEYSFLMNLGILSTATLYTRLSERKQESVIKVSVGTALSSFILIVFYHAYNRLKSTHKGKIFFRYINTKTISPLLKMFTSAKVAVSANTTLSQARNKSEVTHTTIVLREPLLIN